MEMALSTKGTIRCPKAEPPKHYKYKRYNYTMEHQSCLLPRGISSSWTHNNAATRRRKSQGLQKSAPVRTLSSVTLGTL